jgi:hypothetical protein
LQLREEIRLLKIERDVLRGAALLVCCVKLKDQFNAGAEFLRVERAVPGDGRFSRQIMCVSATPEAITRILQKPSS